MGERFVNRTRVRANYRKANGSAMPDDVLFAECTGLNRKAKYNLVDRINRDSVDVELRSTAQYGAWPRSSTAGAFPTADQLNLTATGTPVLYRLHGIAAITARSCDPVPGTKVMESVYPNPDTSPENERGALRVHNNRFKKLLWPHGWTWGATNRRRLVDRVK